MKLDLSWLRFVFGSIGMSESHAHRALAIGGYLTVGAEQR
jgi:hypothetical protein